LLIASSVSAAESEADAILRVTGIKGGLIVHIGCKDGQLTTDLAAQDNLLVYGLDVDEANVMAARKHAASQKKGSQVAFDVLRSDALPFIPSIANLVVADDLGKVSEAEMMRILAPGGVAYLKKTKTIKPRPKEYDDWTHYLHGPDGHVMSKDLAVGPPFHIQWAGDPQHAKSHVYPTSFSVMVSGGGRLFYIADENIKALPASLPCRWALFARDAFNGVVLWKRPIASWQPSYVKDRNCSPVDLHRRIVASDNMLFCTLSIHGPVTALDAATGATLRTYRNTEPAEEVIHDAGVLYVVANNAEPKAIDRRAMAYKHIEPQAKRIMAFRAESGDALWVKNDADTDGLLPQTLASKNERLFFQNTTNLVCLAATSGKVIWKSARRADYARPGWSSPNLVVFDDVVISADRQSGPGQKLGKDQYAAGGFSTGDLVAFSVKTGERLWSAPCAEGGRAPADVFSVDGRVWYGENLERTKQDYRSVRDLLTGKLIEERPLSDDWPSRHHHRCYQDKATVNYILAGRTGVEFIDFKTGEITPHDWVRGSCKFGIMPSYGLLYAPPDQCGCYIESRLTGFHALAPKRPTVETKTARLITRITNVAAQASTAGDWPTFRSDAARSGCVATRVPTTLKQSWRTSIGKRLTQPVVAGGKLFVASTDDHTLSILDAASGELMATFIAGGRIDSPPTIANGLAVFGCRDGWVYALRCADGELAWRFRAAPEEGKLVAQGQVESVWPVHGSVLIQDGFVYACAGRNSYLDGGVRSVKLDLQTGQLKLEKNFYSRDPKTGKTAELYPSFLAGTKHKLERTEMPGVLPDVFSSDGKRLWMRAVTFDTQFEIQREFPAHLFSSMGFLDDSWWELSYWIYGEHFYSGRAGIDRAKTISPSGRIMVFSASKTYAYQDETFRNTGLVAMGKKSKTQVSGSSKKKAAGLVADWRTDVPLYPQGMVMAGDTLFVAGPPRFDERKTRELMKAVTTDDYEFPPVLKEASDTFEGRKGGVLWAVNVADGKQIAELKLDSIPVFDGLIAANSRLYVSLKDGSVTCFGPR